MAADVVAAAAALGIEIKILLELELAGCNSAGVAKGASFQLSYIKTFFQKKYTKEQLNQAWLLIPTRAIACNIGRLKIIFTSV